jgi:hypothetical protein
MKLKDKAVNTFMALARDQELLQLLGVPTTKLTDAKKQILEDKFPNLVTDDKRGRLCVYELTSHSPLPYGIDRGWVEIDIYVHKDVNIVDRRVLLVAERLVCLLDNEERKKVGLQPVQVGAGFNFDHRIPNMTTESVDWVKYGLVFKYDSMRL